MLCRKDELSERWTCAFSLCQRIDESDPWNKQKCNYRQLDFVRTIVLRDADNINLPFRKNKAEILPQCLVAKESGTSLFAFNSNKIVLLLSTLHFDDSINADTGKPQIIIDYNSHKSGTDTIWSNLSLLHDSTENKRVASSILSTEC